MEAQRFLRLRSQILCAILGWGRFILVTVEAPNLRVRATPLKSLHDPSFHFVVHVLLHLILQCPKRYILNPSYPYTSLSIPICPYNRSSTESQGSRDSHAPLLLGQQRILLSEGDAPGRVAQLDRCWINMSHYGLGLGFGSM